MCGWKNLMHYQDRSPVWIKLHSAWLSDYRFQRLADHEKLALILLWMLAAKTNNRIPTDPDWLQWRLAISSPVDLRALYEAGFIELHGVKPEELAGVKMAPAGRAMAPRDMERIEREAGHYRRAALAPVGAYPEPEEWAEEPEAAGLVWPPAEGSPEEPAEAASPAAAADLFDSWSKRQPV